MKKEEILNKIFTTEDKIIQAGDLSNGAAVIVNINNDFYAIKLSDLLALSSGGDASDVDYDNNTSGLTAEDVQAAIDELVGMIPAIPVTSVRNGIQFSTVPGEETIAEQGGNLTKVTTINLNGNSYQLISVDSLTKIRIIQGTLELEAPTAMIFKLPTVTPTSQNKTIQLSNTLGAASLVNKGMYAKISGTYSTPVVLACPAPNGLAPVSNTNIINLSTTGVLDFTGQVNGIQSSRINNSGTDDFSATYGILFLLLNSLLAGTRNKIKMELNVVSDTNILGLPIAYSGYAFPTVGYFVNEHIANAGCPRLLSGVGYREATYCGAGEKATVRSEFVFNHPGAGSENLSTIGFYRNTGLGTDGSVANVSVYGWSFEIEQF